MAKITIQFDAITVRPNRYDEEKGVSVDITYKYKGEEIHTVANQLLGAGLDINMLVECEFNPTRTPAPVLISNVN
jgi:hypothetical protein